MWEKLFLYDEKPDLETVPALKLTSFPYAIGAWRPLCQLVCCAVKNDGIYFRFKPFEAEPKKGENGILSGSTLTVALSFKGKTDILFISADGYGKLEYKTLENREIFTPPSVSKTALGGDQQGDYFSLYIKVPFKTLDDLFGVSSLSEGDKLLCNAFYTILENNSGYKEHFAALFDNGTDISPLQKLYDKTNLDILTAVEFY